MNRVLILGGTTEATALTRALGERDELELTTSFAGRTSSPRAAAGRTRVGGFGGVTGLIAYLRAESIDVLVDATHPFAAVMRHHAAVAAGTVGIPRLRVERPAWTAGPGDRWTMVDDLHGAASAVDPYRRVFLTTGRTELAPFAARADTWFLVRSIEPPDPMPLAAAEVILDKGPFTVDGERALMVEHRIDVVVAKNSGGEAAGAKLVAARELGLPVVMVDRPPNPDGLLVTTVEAALMWLGDVLPSC